MNQAERYGKGIAFPPRVGSDGRVAWSVGAQNVRESIRIILSTDFKERVMLPEFGGGLRSYLFQPNTVATRQLIQERASRVLARWEPRLEVVSVSVAADPDDPDAAVMELTYRLRASGTTERETLSLRFAG